MNGFRFKEPKDVTRYTRGPQFHSLDGGRTWNPGPPPVRPGAPKVTVTVTKVDYGRGIVEAT